MTRYFFHLHNRVGETRDTEGRELGGPEQARTEALRDVRSILSQEVLEGVLDLTGRLDVADESGAKVLTMQFEEAVELRL